MIRDSDNYFIICKKVIICDQRISSACCVYDESEDGKDEETTNLDSDFDIEAARWVVVVVLCLSFPSPCHPFRRLIHHTRTSSCPITAMMFEVKLSVISVVVLLAA
jgi:hypothetical protein